MKKLVVVLFMIVLAGCAPKENCMAVEFSGSTGQRIDFGSTANVYGLSQKSISFWTVLDNVTNTSATHTRHAIGLAGLFSSGSQEAWVIAIAYGENGNIAFSQNFVTTDGQWRTGNILSTATTYHVVITYDNTSVSNNPVIYVNGAVQAISETSTPDGLSGNDNGAPLRIGSGYDIDTDYRSIDGIAQDVRIYNRILSANEILTLYNSRCLRNVMNGLVFWAPMWGANADTFDGNTLSASETVSDWAGGAVGVPSGSPIGRGNTIQSN